MCHTQVLISNRRLGMLRPLQIQLCCVECVYSFNINIVNSCILNHFIGYCHNIWLYMVSMVYICVCITCNCGFIWSEQPDQNMWESKMHSYITILQWSLMVTEVHISSYETFIISIWGSPQIILFCCIRMWF